jgi:hypothetical protein
MDTLPRIPIEVTIVYSPVATQSHPTEVVAPAPWNAQLWLVDADCAFHDPTPTTVFDEPTSVHVQSHVPEESIATLRQFSPEATAMLTDLTEARPMIV